MTFESLLHDLLQQCIAINPRIYKVNVTLNAYKDGDTIVNYMALEPGGTHFGDTPEELLEEVKG